MAARLDWLVVGLGNPGARYEGTRHNIGFVVADGLLEYWQGEAREAFAGSYGEVRDHDAGRIGILKPMTFMNRSGESLQRAMQETRVAVDRIVVVHDEIDIPEGELRHKRGGGIAGHNGLRSIVGQLGTQDFHRVRVGVGRPPAGDPRSVSAWVLARFGEDVDSERMASLAATMVTELVRTGAVEPARRSAFELRP